MSRPLPKAAPAADTAWDDDEIVFTKMSRDTVFLFDRMTVATLDAVAVQPGEKVLDVACGRAIDAVQLARRGGEMYGSEPSAQMAEKANAWLQTERPLVTLVRSLAENLPFADRSFDKVVCKGAIDHFVHAERSVAEMARVCKPGGRVIIAVANFESLSCRMGRALDRWRRRMGGPAREGRAFWEMPEDHNFPFSPNFLRRCLEPCCTVESVLGVSLFWGFPHWGRALEIMPPRMADRTLAALDLAARRAPAWSDVLIATAKPKNQAG